MSRSVFSHKDVVKLSYEFVGVMAHRNPDHGEGDFLVGKERVHLCNLYDLPSCKAHEEMAAELSRRNLLSGVRATPTHILYTPDLEEISRANYMTVANIEDAVKEAQKRLGKPVRWKTYSKLHQAVAAARTAIGKGDYRAALKALKGFDPKGMEGLEEEAAALREEILGAGREKLEAAKAALEAGDASKATKLLRDVARHFGGTEVAEEAKKLLAEARK